jgi:hypothetical protein
MFGLLTRRGQGRTLLGVILRQFNCVNSNAVSGKFDEKSGSFCSRLYGLVGR